MANHAAIASLEKAIQKWIDNNNEIVDVWFDIEWDDNASWHMAEAAILILESRSVSQKYYKENHE